VDDPATAVRTVGALKQRGDTLIKLQLADDSDPTIMLAILTEAQRLRLPVAAHIPLSADLTAQGFAALTSVEHGNQLLDQCAKQAKQGPAPDMASACQPLLRQMAQRGTAFVPTFVASTGQDIVLGSNRTQEDALLRYTPAPIAPIWAAYRSLSVAGMDAADRKQANQRHQQAMALALQAHQSGVPVLAGTDALDPFVLHGASLHDELQYLTRAGFSNAEALRTATLTPAIFHQLAGQSGQIIPGAQADLLLLEANPLEQISATRSIAMVFKAGHVFNRQDLDRMQQFAATQADSHALNARLWWAFLGGSSS